MYAQKRQEWGNAFVFVMFLKEKKGGDGEKRVRSDGSRPGPLGPNTRSTWYGLNLSRSGEGEKGKRGKRQVCIR